MAVLPEPLVEARPDWPVIAAHGEAAATRQARWSLKVVDAVSCTVWPITVKVLAVVFEALTTPRASGCR